ncbi:MAG: ATP-binding protein [Acutalibacteraceae bacterium]|nr:ATP-binding protein [Acutalibacteraceae bacterium]
MDLNKMLDDIERNARSNIPINDCDYVGEDGLLYCGKCNTAKQARVKFLGIERTPSCLCKCEDERLKREAEFEAQKRKQEIIERKRAEAFPDCNSTSTKDMRSWRFEKDDNANPKISQMARRYVEGFEAFKQQGKGLLLHGSTGTGKTFITACIANALIDKGYKVLMTSFSRVENTVFGLSDKQEYYDQLNKYDLLILDDFGVERSTEYKQEIVYHVIDARTKANLPLIITSNITAQELKNPKNTNEQRVFSRLLKMCHPILVTGKDRRIAESIIDYAEMKKLLGV